MSFAGLECTLFQQKKSLMKFKEQQLTTMHLKANPLCQRHQKYDQVISLPSAPFYIGSC
jgi:hypothetical protein